MQRNFKMYQLSYDVPRETTSHRRWQLCSDLTRIFQCQLKILIEYNRREKKNVEETIKQGRVFLYIHQILFCINFCCEMKQRRSELPRFRICYFVYICFSCNINLNIRMLILSDKVNFFFILIIESIERDLLNTLHYYKSTLIFCEINKYK